jgi:HEAT repeats
MMFLRDTTEVIWAFTGTVLGLIVSVALSSIVRQIRHNSTGSSQADRWENATDSVMGFVDGDETRMARFSKLLKADETRPIVIEALSNIARTNATCSVRLRDRDADVAILRQWVSDSLEDKDAGRRAHACEVVGTLRLRACRGMVLAATGDEDVNVKVSATRAMAVIDPESAVGVLLGLIEEEGTWAADLLADLLQRIPASATEAVLLRAREWGATPALVRLLASSPSALANDVLLGALETDDPELRARTAEAVHASSPEAVAALSTLLTDPHEGTRLSAVRSLSRAANPDALLTLSSALSDSSRLVRFAAASGIAGTPGGADVLSRVLTGADRNAAEAAELALWRLNAGALSVVPSDSELESILAAPAPNLNDSLEKDVNSKPTVESSETTSEPNPAERKPASTKPFVSRSSASKAVSKSAVSKLVVTEPVVAEPRVVSKSSPSKPVVVSKPTVSKSSPSKPVVVSKPVVSKPVVSKPTVSKSSRSKPVVSRPTVSKSSPSELVVAEPVVSKPVVVSRPTVSKSSPSELVVSKPGVSKPSLPNPRVSKLSASEPSGSKPAEEVVVDRRSSTLTPFPKQGRRSHEVLAWLEAFLIANDGVASAPMIKAAAAEEGIAERTLERVRPGIATSARQGFGEPANWELINKRSLIDAS